MNAESRTAPTQVPAQRATGQLEQMLAGVATTHSIYAVAKLGIADLLADGPRSTEELASLAAVDAPSLYRLLRALASVGVFTEVAPATFVLTSIAAFCTTGTMTAPPPSSPTAAGRCTPTRGCSSSSGSSRTATSPTQASSWTSTCS